MFFQGLEKKVKTLIWCLVIVECILCVGITRMIVQYYTKPAILFTEDAVKQETLTGSKSKVYLHALGDLEIEEGIKLIKKARRKEKDKDFKKSCNKSIKKAETNIAKIRFETLKKQGIIDTEIKELGKTAKQQDKAVVKFMKDYTDYFVPGTIIFKEE